MRSARAISDAFEETATTPLARGRQALRDGLLPSRHGLRIQIKTAQQLRIERHHHR